MPKTLSLRYGVFTPYEKITSFDTINGDLISPPVEDSFTDIKADCKTQRSRIGAAAVKDLWKLSGDPLSCRFFPALCIIIEFQAELATGIWPYTYAAFI